MAQDQFALLEVLDAVRVRGRLEFRVGQILYLAFSLDETVLGFAFAKEEREALDPVEARELVVDAWRMVVPGSCRGPTTSPTPGGRAGADFPTVVGSPKRHTY